MPKTKLFWVTAIALFFVSTVQAQVKTVCSITLNSDNEISTFKNVMGEKNYKYIELVKNDENKSQSSAEYWFEDACETNVQCDVLVISGHFAGSFFGASGKKLALTSLEKYSCESKCDGIIKRPKEVYLFGCNTLAGKEKDQRNPDEYRQVLIGRFRLKYTTQFHPSAPVNFMQVHHPIS